MTQDNDFNHFRDQFIFVTENICPWKRINISVYVCLFLQNDFYLTRVTFSPLRDVFSSENLFFLSVEEAIFHDQFSLCNKPGNLEFFSVKINATSSVISKFKGDYVINQCLSGNGAEPMYVVWVKTSLPSRVSFSQCQLYKHQHNYSTRVLLMRRICLICCASFQWLSNQRAFMYKILKAITQTRKELF
jgi:hypothetical protein